MIDHFHGNIGRIGQCDHTISNEYLIFGPPGTGKTREAARQVGRAVEKYGVTGVLVTSFSRAAATELAGRDLPIIAERLGTLHAICWRALGQPRIAELHVEQWNHDNPTLILTSANRVKLDGEAAGEDHPKLQGDLLLRELGRCRGMMLPPDRWPTDLLAFASKWERYKRSNGLVDFCDLIEMCHRDLAVAPGSPSVLIADEAQDLNLLQTDLVRKWGERTEYFIRAGDDDQTIYSFAGATPRSMLDSHVPDDHKTVLQQSYRLPAAIHNLAENLIQTVSTRQVKTYYPRPEPGAVHRIAGTYKAPEYAILASAERQIGRGKTVMFLASCGYMLQPLLQVLRKHHIPYHNPYRRSDGFWNPLRVESRASAASRIRALLRDDRDQAGAMGWTVAELTLWAEWLREPAVLWGGSLDSLKRQSQRDHVTVELLRQVLEPDALASLLAASDSRRTLLGWWRQRVRPEFLARIQFPGDLVSHRGAEALARTPQVIIGTAHSVKGGQADVVYLFPDLSHAGANAYSQHGDLRDSVIRLFYVGITRAREILYICEPAGAASVRL